MSTSELRKELHNYIDKADETFLKMVHALSKEYRSSTIAGYHTDGTPISFDDLRENVKAASDRVKSGKYISQEDIEKEIKNW